jgi:hypothetical protein
MISRSFFSGISAALLFLLVALPIDAAVTIQPNDPQLVYTGRIDFSHPGGPLISWPNSSIAANFTGSSLGFVLEDQRGRNSFNVFIDGDLDHPIVIHCEKGEKNYPIADQLSAGAHQFLLTKRTEGEEGATAVKAIVVADGAGLLAPPKRPPHHLEIYGDSITSGMGNEAADGAPDNNPREKNSFLSYGAIAARNLNCELHMISQSGIGIMISWFDFTMPEFYAQLSAVGKNSSRWDFTTWTPEVVVINLFQNDCWLVDREHRLKPEPTDAQRIQAYVNFVNSVRQKYPKAYFVCALGSMDATKPGSKWPGYVSAAVEKIRAEDPQCRIDALFFEFTGYQAHPRVKQHQANAAKLTAFLHEKMGW